MNYEELKDQLTEIANFDENAQKKLAAKIVQECKALMKQNTNESEKTINKRRMNAYDDMACLYEMQDELKNIVIETFKEVTNKIESRKEKITKINMYIGDYFENENKILEDKFYQKYKKGQFIEPNEYLIFIQKLVKKPSDVEYLNYLYQKHVLNSEIDKLNYLSFKIVKSYGTLPPVPRLPKKAFNNDNIEKSCEIIKEFMQKK